MKNLKFLSMMLMLMVGLVSFSSCDDDDNDLATDGYGNPLIYGTWKFDSRSDENWDTENRDVIQNVTFKNDGTGSISGTEIVPNKTTTITASFVYVLTWKDGVGTLVVTDAKGYSYNFNSGTYTLNSGISYGNILSGNVLRLNGITYRK